MSSMTFQSLFVLVTILTSTTDAEQVTISQPQNASHTIPFHVSSQPIMNEYSSNILITIQPSNATIDANIFAYNTNGNLITSTSIPNTKGLNSFASCITNPSKNIIVSYKNGNTFVREFTLNSSTLTLNPTTFQSSGIFLAQCSPTGDSYLYGHRFGNNLFDTPLNANNVARPQGETRQVVWLATPNPSIAFYYINDGTLTKQIGVLDVTTSTMKPFNFPIDFGNKTLVDSIMKITSMGSTTTIIVTERNTMTNMVKYHMGDISIPTIASSSISWSKTNETIPSITTAHPISIFNYPTIINSIGILFRPLTEPSSINLLIFSPSSNTIHLPSTTIVTNISTPFTFSTLTTTITSTLTITISSSMNTRFTSFDLTLPPTMVPTLVPTDVPTLVPTSAPITKSPSQTPTSSPITSAPATTQPTTNPTASPTKKNEAFGCKDDCSLANGQHILELYQNVSGLLTRKKCAIACSVYNYYGLLNGDSCYCGYTLRQNIDKAATQCATKKCPGNASETCGGLCSMEVYKFATQVIRPTSRVIGKVTTTRRRSGLSAGAIVAITLICIIGFVALMFVLAALMGKNGCNPIVMLFFLIFLPILLPYMMLLLCLYIFANMIPCRGSKLKDEYKYATEPEKVRVRRVVRSFQCCQCCFFIFMVILTITTSHAIGSDLLGRTRIQLVENGQVSTSSSKQIIMNSYHDHRWYNGCKESYKSLCQQDNPLSHTNNPGLSLSNKHTTEAQPFCNAESYGMGYRVMICFSIAFISCAYVACWPMDLSCGNVECFCLDFTNLKHAMRYLLCCNGCGCLFQFIAFWVWMSGGRNNSVLEPIEKKNLQLAVFKTKCQMFVFQNVTTVTTAGTALQANTAGLVVLLLVALFVLPWLCFMSGKFIGNDGNFLDLDSGNSGGGDVYFYGGNYGGGGGGGERNDQGTMCECGDCDCLELMNDQIGQFMDFMDFDGLCDMSNIGGNMDLGSSLDCVDLGDCGGGDCCNCDCDCNCACDCGGCDC